MRLRKPLGLGAQAPCALVGMPRTILRPGSSTAAALAPRTAAAAPHSRRSSRCTAAAGWWALARRTRARVPGCCRLHGDGDGDGGEAVYTACFPSLPLAHELSAK